jgi:hypothetical protein
VVHTVDVRRVEPAIESAHRVHELRVADELPTVVDLDEHDEQPRIESEQHERGEEEVAECSLDPIDAKRGEEVEGLAAVMRGVQ